MIPLHTEFFTHRLNLLDVALLGLASIEPITTSANAGQVLKSSRVDCAVSLKKLRNIGMIVEQADGTLVLSEFALSIIGPREPPP